MTVTALITGTVAGFVLVIDPKNEKGKFERIEFTDAGELHNRRTTLDREESAYYRAHPNESYNPTDTHFFTQYRRDDDGTIVDQDGYPLPMKGRPNVKAGDAAYLSKCKCGDTRWSTVNQGDPLGDYPITGEHLCENCNKSDPDDDYSDFSNYNGSQEREY